MELHEIQLSPERAKVGLDIRVVGYVVGAYNIMRNDSLSKYLD